MDGVVILLVAMVMFVIYRPPRENHEEQAPVQIEVNPRLNPGMIHDEHAFMKIAHELGFD